jgi:PKD repeat protein
VITNVAAGTYTLTAVVTDSNGKTTTSAPVSISVTAATGTVINETSLGNVSITLGGLTRVGKTTSYAQSVTVKNTSTATIIGPISLVLDNLSAAATLTGAAGKTTVPSLGTVGSPYVSSTGNLSPGATTVYSLTFSDPTLGVITYQSRILAGPGTR